MDYDVIVIGSGAGGLTAGVALAQAGKSVCVLEQHHRVGGWCHSFALRGFRFSPGVHYVGGLEQGAFLRRLYEGLGLGGRLAFREMNPAGYDQIWLGSRRFDLPAGEAQFRAYLLEQFPFEHAGIEAYIERMTRLGRAVGDEGEARPGDRLLLVREGLRPIGPWLESIISDPLLRGLLVAQSGVYGLPASKTPQALHAGVYRHYLEGAYYPMGGAQAIPDALVEQLRAHHGELRLKARVREICFEKKRATGVLLSNGERLNAPVVISNADPGVTFGALVPKELVGWRWRRKLNKSQWSATTIGAFVGTSLDLSQYGISDSNIWLYDSADVEGVYRDEGPAPWTIPGDQPFSGAFMTAPTFKDPEARADGKHSLEFFNFCSWRHFEKWSERPKGARGGEYEAAKAVLAQRALATIKQRIPDIEEDLELLEISTPLTNVHYCAATAGNAYGTAKIASQLGPFAWPIKTPLKGLFLAGASTLAHGVSGASYTGLVAAAKILGSQPEELLERKGPALEIRRDKPRAPVAEVPLAASPIQMPLVSHERSRALGELRPRFKVATWNLGYLSGMDNNTANPRSGHDFRLAAEDAQALLERVAPDLLLLQEVDFGAKRSFEVDQGALLARRLDFGEAALAKTWDKRYVPYPYWPPKAHFGQVLSGQAILSQAALRNHRRVELKRRTTWPVYDYFYLDRVAQVAEVSCGGQSVMLINLHLEAFDRATREAQIDQVLALVRAWDGPLLLGGDFNCVPPWASKQHGLEAEPGVDFRDEQTLRKVLSSGLVELQPPGEESFTFPADKAEMRLDYLFYTPQFFSLVGWEVEDVGRASDHRLLWGEFELNLPDGPPSS